MKAASGSKRSPIAIDDSEEEVLQELCELNPDSPPRSVVDQRNRLGGELVGENFTIEYHRQEEDEEEAESESGKRPQKRKRSQSESRNVSMAGPSHHNLPALPIGASHMHLLSKKARKRRRKMERQVTGALAEGSVKYQIQVNGPGSTLYNPGSLVTSQAWSNEPMGYQLYQQQAVIPPLYVLPPLPYPSCANSAAGPSPMTSTWASSMALAAEASMQVDGWDLPPRQPEWPPPGPPHLPLPNSPSAVRAASPVRKQPPEPPCLAAPILPKPRLGSPPSPGPHIGMKPEQDPSSKHGLFQIPITSAPSTGDGAARPYIPNPARTLVMEQLPKSHRNAVFINSWSKKACGAHPVYMSIDGGAAKALTEFATAELARKAWGSPKLGTSLATLKTHHLKGKPREDLIKVWWYRVDGVGAGAGVGEIEEGEIEGDAADIEVEVPMKKETKKERKARLAKERLAKREKLHDVKITPSIIPSPLPSDMSAVPSISPVSMAPHPAAFPLNLALRGQPESMNFLEANLSHSLPFRSQLPARVPLFHQPTLASNWREKHPLPKRPDPTSYGASVTQTSNNRRSSVSSICSSSRSFSPERKDSLARPQLELIDYSTPEDMDLESPNPAKRASLDLSLSPLPSLPGSDHNLTATRIPPTRPQPLSPLSLHPVAATIPPPLSPGIMDPTTPSLVVLNTTLPSPIISPPLFASTTPPIAPSEPRAMKNPPKGPSFTKRSLIARQKELEERITRTKLELGLSMENSSPKVSLTASPEPEIAPTPYSEETGKQVMEERLRMLVLQSQRSKLKSPPSATPPTAVLDHAPLSRSPTPTPPLDEAAILSTSSSSAANGFSLDDLAVSFIKETIQTCKSSPVLPLVTPPVPKVLPPALKPPNPARTELAARQQHLEQYIAESKVLMAQLTQARTKQEKNSILAVMREQSRSMEESHQVSMLAPSLAPSARNYSNGSNTSNNIAQASSHSTPQISTKWPDSHHDAGVLIISDDEEAEYDNADEDMF